MFDYNRLLSKGEFEMKYMLDVEDNELWKQIKKDAALKDISISSLIQDLLKQYIDLGEVLNRWEEENKKEGTEGYKSGFSEGFFWATEIPKKDLKKALKYKYDTIDEPFDDPLFKDTLCLCQENDEDLGIQNDGYTENWLQGFFNGMVTFYEKAESALLKRQQDRSK